MNQKAFAIFVGALMVLSAFAGFVLMGSNQNDAVVASNADSLQTFGVQGHLVDWNFDGLKDVLEMSPQSTVMAYWINLTASQNLTDAARAALPQSLGLNYGSQIYSTKIERLADIYFNNTWTGVPLDQAFPGGLQWPCRALRGLHDDPGRHRICNGHGQADPLRNAGRDKAGHRCDLRRPCQPKTSLLSTTSKLTCRWRLLASGGASMPLSEDTRSFTWA